MTDPSPASRRRGAQPGNANALKHGFYSSRLQPAERRDLPAAGFSSLQDEIALLRIQLRRLLAFFQVDPGLAESITLMRTVCLTVTSLNRLIKTQQFLGREEPALDRVLSQALEQALQDLASAGPTPPARPEYPSEPVPPDAPP